MNRQEHHKFGKKQGREIMREDTWKQKCETNLLGMCLVGGITRRPRRRAGRRYCRRALARPARLVCVGDGTTAARPWCHHQRRQGVPWLYPFSLVKRYLGQLASTASPLHSHSEQEVQIPPTNHHPSKEFVLVHQHKRTEFRSSH
jgi:hypothetical protein